MQDNVTCHKSRCTMQFLEEEKVCIIDDWPPQSPDLNVIENLWAILKSQVFKQNPKSVEELWLLVQEEWKAITDDVIIKLYESIIMSRTNAILKAK